MDTITESTKKNLSLIHKRIETLQKNLHRAQTFYEIETVILKTLNFETFIQTLLSEIKSKLVIHHVWISLIEGTEVSSILTNSVSASQMKGRVTFVSREIYENITGGVTDPKLINTDLLSISSIMLPSSGDQPSGDQSGISSVAIVPLLYDDKIIGSLNHGDPSADRYRPGGNPKLLTRLSTIVSICMSNVISHEKLNALASRDPLTGLLNRRVLEHALKREYDRSVRFKLPLAAAFLDVDYFKPVNDTYGHKVGDDLLKHIASHMLTLVRENDVVGRFAGDEFVIILVNISRNDALEFKKRLQAYFAYHPMWLNSVEKIDVSISCGVVHSEDGEFEDYKAFLQKADDDLYEDKKTKGTRKTGPKKIEW